jgi:alcohol dehydrogenase
MAKDTMKAMLYRSPGDYGLTDVPLPKIVEPDDVILRPTLNLICTSDVHICQGHMSTTVTPPKIQGHEFCGVIEEIGPAVKGFKVGDRVVVNAASKCGECANCKKGKPARFCLTPGNGVFGGGGPNGAQAEYIRLPKGAVYMNPIPDNQTEEDVILIPDMLCTGHYGVTEVGLGLGDTLVVIGCGPVGMSTCLVARLFNPKTIIAVDVVDYLLEAAVENGVADYTINSAKENVVERVRELTGGAMASTVVETVGLNATFNMAIQVAGFHGRFCSVALFSEPISIPVMNMAVVKNLKMFVGIQESAGRDLLFEYLFCSSGKVLSENARQAIVDKIAFWEEQRELVRYLYRQGLGAEEIRDRLYGPESSLYQKCEEELGKIHLVRAFLKGYTKDGQL